MDKNFDFYTVSDRDGIVTVIHPNYATLKAVFRDKEEAEKVIANNPGKGLVINTVNITDKAQPS